MGSGNSGMRSYKLFNEKNLYGLCGEDSERYLYFSNIIFPFGPGLFYPLRVSAKVHFLLV